VPDSAPILAPCVPFIVSNVGMLSGGTIETAGNDHRRSPRRLNWKDPHDI
jgi:hypothetical protein